MKGKSAKLRNATAAELWQRFQRPLSDLELWMALAQRLLEVTTSLPDMPSIHTFLPQIEVIGLHRAGRLLARCDVSHCSVSVRYQVHRKCHLFSGTKVMLSSWVETKAGVTPRLAWTFSHLEVSPLETAL